jgi:hypothetical protein
MNKNAPKKHDSATGTGKPATGSEPESRVASKASLDEADMRQERKASDRGPEEHPDEPVPHTGAQPGDPRSAGSRDQATHTEKQKHGEKRDGL